MSRKSRPDRFRNFNWHDDGERFWATLDRRFRVIQWGWEGPRDQGGHGEQSCEDFMQHGPMDANCPADIVAELRTIIDEEGLARPPSPPKIHWTWTDGGPYNRYEAFIDFAAKDITWTWLGPKDLGGAGTQSFEEFFRNGPMEPTAPEYVLNGIRKAVLGTGFRPAEGLAEESLPAPKADVSDGMTALIGLAVIATSVGLAWLFSKIDPMLARFGSLFGSILLGFAASFKFGRGLLVPAGFFGMAAAIAFLMPYERALEVARGAAIRIETPDEASRHPEATRFTIGKLRLRADLAGRHEVKTTRNFGSGPRDQITVYHVAPLVTPDWQKGEAVPAWIACSTTPGFDCLSRNPAPNGFVRVRDDDVAAYRGAVQAAQARHALRSQPEVALLAANSAPEEAPWSYLRLALVLPAGAAVGWLALSLGYLIWRRRRQTP